MAPIAARSVEIDRLPEFTLRRFSPDAARDISIRLFEETQKQLTFFESELKEGLRVLEQEGAAAFMARSFPQLENRAETLKALKRKVQDVQYWTGFDRPEELQQADEYLGDLCRRFGANRAAICIEGSVYLYGFSQQERELFISHYLRINYLLAQDRAGAGANDRDIEEARELIKRLGMTSVCRTWWKKILVTSKKNIEISLYKGSGKYPAGEEAILGEAVLETRAIPEKLHEAISKRFKALQLAMANVWTDSTISKIDDYRLYVSLMKNMDTKEDIGGKLRMILDTIQLVRFNFPLARMALDDTLKPEKCDLIKTIRSQFDVYVAPLAEKGVKVSLSLPADSIICTIPEMRLETKMRQSLSVADAEYGPDGEVRVTLKVNKGCALLTTELAGMSDDLLKDFTYKAEFEIDPPASGIKELTVNSKKMASTNNDPKDTEDTEDIATTEFIFNAKFKGDDLSLGMLPSNYLGTHLGHEEIKDPPLDDDVIRGTVSGKSIILAYKKASEKEPTAEEVKYYRNAFIRMARFLIEAGLSVDHSLENVSKRLFENLPETLGELAHEELSI